jgi:RNA polymerase sigma factor (sigma-70 family)
MTDTRKLLEEYARNGSEGAFRELVVRYIDLVYSTALRLVAGDTQLAEDTTQTVFINLAQKGGTLSREVQLGGWLHRHTFHVATKALRGERRRQFREREAVAMNSLHDNSEAEWKKVAPSLDEAITQLGSEDRTAILLRFFEQRDFRSVGQALGSNEDAARMRVNRALEKLHSLLRARGVTLSAAALGTVLSAQAVTGAPAGLAMATASAALSSATVGTGTLLGFLKLMATTKLKLSLLTLAMAGAATTLLIQHQAQVGQRDENNRLRLQIAQLRTDNEDLSRRVAQGGRSRVSRLPAPTVPLPAQTASLPSEILPSTNLYALLTNKTATLAAAQIEPYLKMNHRSAASLLAAFRTTGDTALLEEAMQRFPRDPQVGFEAALRKEASPAEKRQWLDAFKQSAPDNALSHYLSATDYFKAGQADQAIRDLVAASGKAQFQDYSLDRMQNDEEAYRTAGYSVAEARSVANLHLVLPQLVQVKDLAGSIVDLAKSYQQTGDEASRQAALGMAIELGQRYSSASSAQSLISQLVGVSVERMALNAMDPGSPYGNEGQTVQDRLGQLTQQRTALRELVAEAEPLFPTMTEQDWISYHNRSSTFGEQNALQWLVGKYGQQ